MLQEGLPMPTRCAIVARLYAAFFLESECPNDMPGALAIREARSIVRWSQRTAHNAAFTYKIPHFLFQILDLREAAVGLTHTHMRRFQFRNLNKSLRDVPF